MIYDLSNLQVTNELKNIINTDEYIVLDLETCTLRKIKGSIIEIGMAKFKNGQIVDEYKHFCKPYMPIPKNIENLTHITNIDVMKELPFTEITNEVEDFIGDTVVVGHNYKAFDRLQLYANGIPSMINHPFIDTMRLSRYGIDNIDIPTQKNRLDDLIEYFDVEIGRDYHDALNDVVNNGYVFEAMKDYYYHQLLERA